MATAPIVFGDQQQSGDQELAGASPLAINVLVDGAGAVRRRPGLSAWDKFPTTVPHASQVDGLGQARGELYYVTADRTIFRLIPESGAVENCSTTGADSFLAGTGRPVLAETQFRIVIAGGAAPERVNVGTGVTAALLGGSPPNCSHVAAMSSRLFLDNQTGGSANIGHINFSGVGSAGNETFDALDFVSAEARPDSIISLRENTNELFAFGQTSLQVFSPDPTIVLAPGRTKNRGCLAGHSPIRQDEDFAWLDDKKQFVLSDGRADQVLSEPINATLDSIPVANLTDCWGFRYAEGQWDALVWALPTDGRTFCFSGGWSQWQGWTEGQGFTAWPGKSHFYWSQQGVNLVGLSTGQIAKLDLAANTDLGGRIKAEVTTGFLNRDTLAIKDCQVLRLVFKRGVGTTTDPRVLLSWRDDLGGFKGPKVIGLGTTGQKVFTVEIRSLGTYRARQWKLEFSDTADFILAKVEEVFQVVGDGDNA